MRLYSCIAVATVFAASSQAQSDDLDCSGDVIIQNQSQASALAGCDNLGGNIILGADISGDIIIPKGSYNRGYGFAVEKNVTNVECNSDGGDCRVHKSNLTSLTIDGQIWGAIHLQELPKLTNLSIPSRYSAVFLHFSKLPELQAINYVDDSGSKPGDTMRVEEAYFSDLPKLETVGSANRLEMDGNITISRVGMKKTSITLNFGSRKTIDKVELEDDDGIEFFHYYSYEIMPEKDYADPEYPANFTVVGTGKTNASITFKEDGYSFFGKDDKGWNVSLSALQSLRLDTDNWDVLQVDEFSVSNTSIEELDLPLSQARHLVISDNPDLKKIDFSSDFANYNLKSVTIARNPKLNLAAEYGPKIYDDGGTELDEEQEGSDKFCWPGRNLDSAVFQGNFSDDFL
ncbi:cell wall protein Ecm33 [Lecanicillium sp. MT-2017a]|nr:cell wall protein Ecm33 [Lecanicillium sp. MT-2017a]